ncbi:hypothetical protein [Serratia liquefaciens]|uniref:hypothetical protein n=1 Tax=Serratia liquefaciens TaxID=614 RepID=UPI003826A5F4
MFMFLPFLIAMSVVLGTIIGKDKISYILWGALLVVIAQLFCGQCRSEVAVFFT